MDWLIASAHAQAATGAHSTAAEPISNSVSRRPRRSAIQPPATPPNGAVEIVRPIMVATTRPSSLSGVMAWRSVR